jgi:hypothetical protein
MANMIPLGTVLGASTASALFLREIPFSQILTLVALVLGLICIWSFLVTRLLKKLF